MKSAEPQLSISAQDVAANGDQYSAFFARQSPGRMGWCDTAKNPALTLHLRSFFLFVTQLLHVRT
jgi:hypothetical protein